MGEYLAGPALDRPRAPAYFRPNSSSYFPTRLEPWQARQRTPLRNPERKCLQLAPAVYWCWRGRNRVQGNRFRGRKERGRRGLLQYRDDRLSGGFLSDPSYAGQIVAFTFPHIGIVGANEEDIEDHDACGARDDYKGPSARSLELPRPDDARSMIEGGTMFRDCRELILGVLPHIFARNGMPHGVIAHASSEKFDIDALIQQAKAFFPAWKAWTWQRKSPAAKVLPGMRTPWGLE